MEVTEAVGWPASGPSWASRVALMGLIGAIPVLGQMALLGWMLGALENLRGGRRELPRAGFGHAARGARLFLVMLAYALGYCAVVAVPFLGGTLLLSAAGRGAAPAAAALGFLLLVLTVLLALAGLVLLALCQPQIVLAVEARGLRGGLDVPAVVASGRSRPQAWLLCGLMTVAAHLVAGLGLALCGVGMLFTLAYAYAMIAAISHSFETA